MMRDAREGAGYFLEARDIVVQMRDHARGSWLGGAPIIEILHGVSVSVRPGEAVGIVGLSGSGKTSLGRVLMGLLEIASGSLFVDGRDVTGLKGQSLHRALGSLSMVFQDSLSSLNPRMRVWRSVARGLGAQAGAIPLARQRDMAMEAFGRVGLEEKLAARYPHQLSGGQQRRVGIARAIIKKPALIVADEIVSGLDVSTQAQILSLLQELQKTMGLALLLISHDLNVVHALCTRIVIMRAGRIEEEGDCADIFAGPRTAYARELLDAVPDPVVDPHWLDHVDAGEIPDGK